MLQGWYKHHPLEEVVWIPSRQVDYLRRPGGLQFYKEMSSSLADQLSPVYEPKCWGKLVARGGGGVPTNKIAEGRGQRASQLTGRGGAGGEGGGSIILLGLLGEMQGQLVR